MSNQQPRVIINPQSLQRPPHPPRRGPQSVRDIRQTKEYKIAARRWLSTIVALPILMYTSYVLYERTYLNKSQKHLARPSGSGTEERKDGSA
ncbi:hypothetical protein F9C07_4837 [Aspergillus flavus]|uniref:Uncharacterized protein n=1 Tax=Aspergillus flavus (strain ATCC 200026 / FGSC A1120 / IAM 13836 / NRRL 3357 / JCM 12722 / SRRC 167) TaxID=332952 RepID=A0A7U2MLC4_ASPFN|nr:hypothetical protein AFLA_007037 [Aspergillus flavus NRRL3357]KOC15007.1 hypothetical protein AFLA70_97g002581 [Aspergillus flavus AF70]QRD85816.1 hypothetical protein F9C07_4837 [Aspergillus flavus]